MKVITLSPFANLSPSLAQPIAIMEIIISPQFANLFPTPLCLRLPLCRSI